MKRFTPRLFPSLDSDYSALALRPLLISDLVTPVVDGDGGVNLDMVENPLGVLSAVDPWQRMAVGDHVAVYWDNTLVGERDVELADIDKRILFFLPAGPIIPDWAERVFYRLTRLGSITPEDSGPLRIRVKLDRPAGTDKEPHLPGHSELAAPGLPQDVIDNGVDATWAARGVPTEVAAYPNRAAHDTIRLKWGAAFVSHRVTASEAAGTASIIITVDQATILAGGDNPRLAVLYEVFDEVWNFATDWSRQTTVNVEAGAYRLPAPIIVEALNSVIDLEVLGTRDVTIQISLPGPPYELNDTVTMTWAGTTNTGASLIHVETVTLTNIPSILDIKVPNAAVRAILDGRAEASYVLTKANGDPPQSSKRAIARITGKIALPAPRVFEAVGDTLDPNLERAHVEIPVYPAMANGDLIDMIWLGTRQNGTPYLHEDRHIVSSGETGEVIYFPVKEEHIAILANGTLDISYRVSNDAVGPYDVRVSDHLNLSVRERYAQLPAPSVDEAVDNVLDPEQVPAHATLRVSYTGTVMGDILTWYWQGESPDGSASDWIPITSLIAGQPVTFDIPRGLIEPNINNLVKVFYSLKLVSTGKYQYSRVLELTIGKLIGDLPPPQVLEADDNVLDPVQAQSGATVRVRYESMDPQDIITLVWIGTPGAGTPPNQEKPADPSGQVDFLIPASVIGANIGELVNVAYQVKRYVTDKQSDILLLDISPVPDSQLPSPLITQANQQTKILNLATFTGHATATVGKWPFIALGQRAWLRLEGQTEAGGPYSIVLLDGAEVTSMHLTAGLSESALRSELEKLGQDTALTAVCKIAFSGVAYEGAALPFPSTVYVLKLHHDWVMPVIVSVMDAKGEVPNSGTTFDTRLTLSGTGTIQTELDIVDGTTSLAIVLTDVTGAWTVELPTVRPKTYSITAVAKDGSGLISQPRTFEVLANVTPIIEQVLGSGGPVSNGGTTVDSSLTLSGKASPDQQVELFDGPTSKGETRTDALGAWSLLIPGLTIATHSFTAKALYGTGPVSTAWVVNVAAAVTPTITHVQEVDGDEISPDGFTVDTSVNLTGTANANLEVEIFDGGRSKGKAATDALGVWTLALTELALSSHAINAKALYGNGPESAVRRFTIVPLVAPTITAVVDPKGSPVTNGGETYASNVTASGQASNNQQVEIFDGGTSKGTTTASAAGAWSRAVSGLGTGNRSLTAKALYSHNPVSAAWSFTVKAATIPTLTSVRDSRTAIPNGGSTTDTSVIASGKAAPSEQVEVFDGITSTGNAAVDGSGDWSHVVSGLRISNHSLKAVAKYGDEPASNVHTFTVRSPIPDFVLNPSAVSLNGKVYVLPAYPDLPPSPWPPGAIYTRVPSSGAPPYSYSSSNTSVVRVNTSGVITSFGNGSATITVTDSQRRSGSYIVNVSNVIQVLGLGNSNWPDANSAASSRGKRIPSHDELNEIAAAYLGRWPMGNRLYWSSTPGAGFGTSNCKNLVTGGHQDLSTRRGFFGAWDYANVVAI